MISGLFLSNNRKKLRSCNLCFGFNFSSIFIIVYFSFNKYLIIEDPIRPSEPVTKHFFSHFQNYLTSSLGIGAKYKILFLFFCLLYLFLNHLYLRFDSSSSSFDLNKLNLIAFLFTFFGKLFLVFNCVKIIILSFGEVLCPDP